MNGGEHPRIIPNQKTPSKLYYRNLNGCFVLESRASPASMQMLLRGRLGGPIYCGANFFVLTTRNL